LPTYEYKYCDGDTECTIERNVPIDERDNQFCNRCGKQLERIISFTGLTWAPTAGGMR
jgi:hypothetical protein